jgi:hypothetical protein
MARRLLPWAWELWAGLVLLSFGVLEYLAFRRRAHRTLSRALASWLGVAPRRRWGRLGPLAFVASWAVLVVHVVRLKTEPSNG